MKSAWFDLVSGVNTGSAATAARAALRVLSVPFGSVVSARKWLYGKRALRRRRASIPVISIGNITLGGTGKTPLVESLARGLLERDRRPAVVMRGYAAGRGGPSDEAAILRGNLGASVPVIEDPNRFRGCETAVRAHACDVAVLDDGFQHLRLERDLDVVAVDATSPFGFGRLLPAGCLRERPDALARADVIVVTRSDLPSPDEVRSLRRELRELAPDALVTTAVFAPTGLETTEGVEGPRLELLKGACIAAFCGIGNPYAFGMSIRRLGADLVLAKRFPDHHPFAPGELNDIAHAAEARGARFVLTTQKDAVRIPEDSWPATAPPLYVLRAEFAFVDLGAAFWGLVEHALERGVTSTP